MVLRLVALALMLATLPVAAAELDADAPQPKEPSQQTLELPIPGVPAVRVDRALDGIRQLRLRPGQDGMNVTETAHTHPAPGTE